MKIPLAPKDGIYNCGGVERAMPAKKRLAEPTPKSAILNARANEHGLEWECQS